MYGDIAEMSMGLKMLILSSTSLTIERKCTPYVYPSIGPFAQTNNEQG